MRLGVSRCVLMYSGIDVVIEWLSVLCVMIVVLFVLVMFGMLLIMNGLFGMLLLNWCMLFMYRLIDVGMIVLLDSVGIGNVMRLGCRLKLLCYCMLFRCSECV